MCTHMVKLQIAFYQHQNIVSNLCGYMLQPWAKNMTIGNEGQMCWVAKEPYLGTC